MSGGACGRRLGHLPNWQRECNCAATPPATRYAAFRRPHLFKASAKPIEASMERDHAAGQAWRLSIGFLRAASGGFQLSMRTRNRKRHSEQGTFPLPAVDRYLPSVQLDNLLDEIEADASSRDSG